MTRKKSNFINFLLNFDLDDIWGNFEEKNIYHGLTLFWLQQSNKEINYQQSNKSIQLTVQAVEMLKWANLWNFGEFFGIHVIIYKLLCLNTFNKKTI